MSDDSDPTVKRITLTAAAAESLSPKAFEVATGALTHGGGTRRKGKKMIVPKEVNVLKEGGGSTSPGTLVQLAASHIPGSNSSKAVGATTAMTASGAEIGKVAPAAPTKGGGQASQKVILTKSRKTKKVMLVAPAKPAATAAAAASVKRKTVKKVKVSLTGLGHKLRRAKTIRNKATLRTLDDVKKELVKANLIKGDSKAPEDILRQMYADYMVLKKRAL